MEIRGATAADVAGIALLVERYWEFESISEFERPRIEQLLAALLSEPVRGGCWVVGTGTGLQAATCWPYTCSASNMAA